MTNASTSDAMQYRNVAYGFSTNTATALPGSQNSQARLFDSSASDVFTGSGSTAKLLNNTATGFHEVDIASVNGGVDTVNVANIDYVFKKFGNWQN